MCQIYSVLLCFFLLFVGCKYRNQNTRLFEKYLQQTFNIEIKDQVHKYILVSEHSCEECAFKALMYSISTYDTDVVFIFPKTMAHYFRRGKSSSILIDSSNAINKLKFHQGNVCKIYTSNKSVDSVLVYNIDNIDLIGEK